MVGFRESLLFMLSTPLYVLIIGKEMMLSYFQHRPYYSIKGVLQNCYMTLLNMGHSRYAPLFRGGRLGFLEWFLVTPSHHRVHHASNVRYLDRNMGMMLIIWDRLFGTFAEEAPEDPVRYGLTTNITDHSPENLVFHEWKKLIAGLRIPGPFGQKIRYLLAPSGWSHDGRSQTADEMRQELGIGIESEMVLQRVGELQSLSELPGVGNHQSASTESSIK